MRTFNGLWKATTISALFLFLTAVCWSQDPGKAKFIDRSNMDLLVKPGDNFVEYAGGNWLRNNSIPAKETSW